MKRPDPEELLARVQQAEQQQTRGKLKVFFGAAAGVGKTYAMLEAAHQRCAEGVDVVVGWVETHGRPETEALLDGLERLPPTRLCYRTAILPEFDLDAALERRPALLLLDELAHTNVPGSRHHKRWQDAEELLQAGIEVYTTVNVQHIESLGDVVAQITGVVIRETVPDAIINHADEIEVVDLSPDDLLQRLAEGKVYVPQQAQVAARHFFRKGNLMALRELALRCAADRVDAQMQHYKRDHAIAQTWPTTERLLVCVSPSPSSARVVRAACRMAQRMQAPWLAVYVETPHTRRLPDLDRMRVSQTLRLAEQLGAEVVTLEGHRAADEIIAYARTRNVSRIMAGKPSHPRWRELLVGSFADTLVRQSDEIDVTFVSGSDDVSAPVVPSPILHPTLRWSDYGWVGVMLVVCTMSGVVLFPSIGQNNVILVYLLGITMLATRVRRSAAVVASVASVVAFNFFFTMPYYTLEVDDSQYLVTFPVMLTVALVISTLTVRIREQAEVARWRERRTAALYAISRAFAAANDCQTILDHAVHHVGEVFASEAVILLPDDQGHVTVRAGQVPAETLSRAECGVAQWVFDHGHLAGRTTDTLPGAELLYVPLLAGQQTVGVLGVRLSQPATSATPEQRHLLEAFASQTALALERVALAAEAQQAQVRVKTERLRSSLLSSVSHDVRTPLAGIIGAASSLLEHGGALGPSDRHDLLLAIYEEAERLGRLVNGVLDMTRIETGTIQVRKEWQPLEEVVGAALHRLDARLHGRQLHLDLPPDLPLVPLDSVLIEQVLINLLDNALKYTPPGSPIALSSHAIPADSGAVSIPASVVVAIADDGPGVPPGDEERIFEKFAQAQPAGARRGVGLGLAICRGMIAAHGGRIWAVNRPGGGAVFSFSLPIEGEPPEVGIME
ncbi:MAG: sensor histidine kinase KdpD [Chloroflexaceae bacterium]|nr:sensor histidine kinase KdpD [Chloroflexaceae bacterium]